MKKNEVEKNESRNNESDAQRKRHSIFQRNKKHIQRKMAIHRLGISGPSADSQHPNAWLDFGRSGGPLIPEKELEIEIREKQGSKVIIKALGK